VESPRLKRIFLILRNELKESDIPGRSLIRDRIMDMYSHHLKKLTEDMKVRPGF